MLPIDGTKIPRSNLKVKHMNNLKCWRSRWVFYTFIFHKKTPHVRRLWCRQILRRFQRLLEALHKVVFFETKVLRPKNFLSFFHVLPQGVWKWNWSDKFCIMLCQINIFKWVKLHCIWLWEFGNTYIYIYFIFYYIHYKYLLYKIFKPKFIMLRLKIDHIFTYKNCWSSHQD